MKISVAGKAERYGHVFAQFRGTFSVLKKLPEAFGGRNEIGARRGCENLMVTGRP